MDWINALDGIIGGLGHGGTHLFTFSTETGWLFFRVELLLRHYHIPVFGRSIVGKGEQGLRVRNTQARWAEYIICSAGIPLTCPLIDQRNDLPSGTTRPMPPPWTPGSGATTPIGHILDFMNTVLPGKVVQPLPLPSPKQPRN